MSNGAHSAPLLKNNGKISGKMAEEKADKEYNEFNKTQKIKFVAEHCVLQINKINFCIICCVRWRKQKIISYFDKLLLQEK